MSSPSALPRPAYVDAVTDRRYPLNVIRADETTVIVLTGSGLKATQRIGELLGVR
jgi:hypothetical protein